MIPINDLSRGFRLYQQEYEEKAVEVGLGYKRGYLPFHSNVDT